MNRFQSPSVFMNAYLCRQSDHQSDAGMHTWMCITIPISGICSDQSCIVYDTNSRPSRCNCLIWDSMPSVRPAVLIHQVPSHFRRLRINCEKTKTMKIGPEQHAPILMMQQNMDYVEKFPYIGSYMSSDGDSEPDVRVRIGKAAYIFQLLRTIWSSTTINLNVKLRLYTAIVIPMTIFACETWKRTAMVVHRLDDLHRRCIRAILSISWRDHVINEEVMRRAGMGVSKALLQQGEGKWLATFSDGSQKDQPIQLGTGCQNTAEESWEAKEDMAEYIPRRLERDGCQLAWGPPDRQ